ncbi:BON domain-containing protein [Pleurocapsales cyanobacterium LEGE 10410]|nr:BON domain-containing protein [Pleurocapsales cyanobacterium LEGE 10410]
MSTIYFLILLSLTTIAIISSKLSTKKRHRLSFAVVMLVMLFAFSYFSSVPVLAADLTQPGAIERFVSEEQQELEEDLNLTPGGNHYSGIEHVDRTSANETAASDEAIEQTLEEFSSDDLTIAVANGSVRLSGKVENKEIARHVIEQTKNIPGVYEVTFDLGLENAAL